MTRRFGALRTLLAIYFLASAAVAAIIAFKIGRGGNLADTTSGRILAGAVLTLGLGALAASFDPHRYRVAIQLVMLFLALSIPALAYRVFFESHTSDPAWLILPGVIIFLAVLGYLYPYDRRRALPHETTDDASSSPSLPESRGRPQP